MNTAALDKQTGDKVSFIGFIIPEFALAYKIMNIREACPYLKQTRPSITNHKSRITMFISVIFNS
ncbi:MAG: hypothetical protein LBQ70_03800 [Prevotellaceae bacterium]|jgi:hypothetical protein|nr:hypothetical protein [Prevotellaceae bacterium]